MFTTYKDAGVSIDAGNKFIKKIIPHVKSTYTPEVLAGVGGFAAHVALNLEGINNPVLVSSTDGVGTKLKIAQKLNKFDTIGIDLVAMCVNDICCSGARPLFFLDYFAVESLRPEEHSEIVKGIAKGCKTSRCSLIGGETAELPGIYQKDDFDLAGFSVGIVDRNKIIDGSKIAVGNSVIGVASSGIHSNGYSLVRKICEDAGLNFDEPFGDSGKRLGEVVLEPTKLYSPLVQDLLNDFEICGIAHITGGGLVENIPRILPEGLGAKLSKESWQRPAIFNLLQEKGNVEESEMQRVFNLGIGLVMIVDTKVATDICSKVKALGEEAWIIGKIENLKNNSAKAILE
jgi:phosphoribosylformylglycinamidine cyclo-ligase